MDKMFQLLEIGLSSLIFTAIGVLSLWLSFYFRRRTKRFIGESIQTYGDVIGLHEVHDEGSITYAPIIRFSTFNGVVREFTDFTSSRPASYNIGDRIKILYHQQNPRDVRIATSVRLYLSSIIFGIIGVVFLSVGVAVTIWHLFSQG
jgi:hypothetical protein